MKKNKLFLIAIISLLLPSCSNTPSPSIDDSSVISGEAEKLSNSLYVPQENYTTDLNSVKIPVGGKSEKNNNNDSHEKLNTKTDLEENEILLIEEPSQSSSKELLATYSSKVYTKTEDRQKNLRIVCDKLSGTILKPDEEFSYNETCGPYNKENGFGKATVFLGDGTETQDYGGGVCQLSSTLYNAVKDLNVDVTERHNHSKKVYYVPDGQDATVSYGNLDFKFKNLNNFSLLFEATSNAQSVDVNIYKI